MKNKYKRPAETTVYKSGARQAIHDTAVGLFEIGVIDKKTMNHYDKTCLTPVEPLKPKQIRQMREREGVSQAIFAHHLNISKDYLSKWERGEKIPSGPALKLLSIVQRKGLDAIA